MNWLKAGPYEQRGNSADPRPPEAAEVGRQHDPLAESGLILAEQEVATVIDKALAFARSSSQPEDALLEVFASWRANPSRGRLINPPD